MTKPTITDPYSWFPGIKRLRESNPWLDALLRYGPTEVMSPHEVIDLDSERYKALKDLAIIIARSWKIDIGMNLETGEKSVIRQCLELRAMDMSTSEDAVAIPRAKVAELIATLPSILQVRNQPNVHRFGSNAAHEIINPGALSPRDIERYWRWLRSKAIAGAETSLRDEYDSTQHVPLATIETRPTKTLGEDNPLAVITALEIDDPRLLALYDHANKNQRRLLDYIRAGLEDDEIAEREGVERAEIYNRKSRLRKKIGRFV